MPESAVAQHMAVALVSSWSLYKLREITASDRRASQSVHKTESISEDKCKKATTAQQDDSAHFSTNNLILHSYFYQGKALCNEATEDRLKLSQ